MPKKPAPKTKPRSSQTHKPSQNSVFRNAWVHMLLAFSLFAASAVLVHDREMHPVEIAVFNWAYNLPEIFTPIFFVVTQLGNVYVFFVLAALLLVKKYYHVVTRLLMAGALAYLLSGVGKDLVGRPRPDMFIDGIVFNDYIVRGSGFPSGHMALATAVGLTLGHYLPNRLWWVPTLLIIGVGFSRLQLGVHGPMDLVGGFAIGWFAFVLTRFVHIKVNLKGN